MDTRRFLVVEDDDIAERAMRKILTPLGDMVHAPTVRDARRLLGEQAVLHGIFIDLGLPDGSGLDVLTHARHLHPLVPVMVLTGGLEPRAINAAFDHRADYVIKPVDKARITQFLTTRGDFAQRLAQTVAVFQETYKLSAAEVDVLQRACAGQPREEIASARGSAMRTVKTHIVNLLGKTGDDSLYAVVGRVLRIVAGDRGAEI